MAKKKKSLIRWTSKWALENQPLKQIPLFKTKAELKSNPCSYQIGFRAVKVLFTIQEL